MNAVKSITKAGLGLFLLFLIPLFAYNQQYNFKNYNINDGLCHPFIYTINQDNKGFLWIGTGQGLCKFNGLEFSSPSSADSITRAYVSSSFKDSNGDLWFGHDDGNITRLKNNSLQRVLSKNNLKLSSTINSIVENTDGELLIASQNEGIFKIKKDGSLYKLEGLPVGEYLYSLNILDNLLLVGTANGLIVFKISGTEIKEVARPKEISYTKIQDITLANDKKGFWISTEDMGVFYLTGLDKSKFNITKIEPSKQLEYANVQSVFEDKAQNLWLSTFEGGIFKLVYDSLSHTFNKVVNFNDKNGLGSQFIKKVFIDTNGSIWAGTYGNGLSVFYNQAFSVYRFPESKFGRNVYSIAVQDSFYWVGGESSLMRFNYKTPTSQLFIDKDKGLPNDAVTSLYFDGGKLWIGTGRNGLYALNTSSMQLTKVHESSNSLENMVNYITGDKQKIWIATNNGILSIDKKTGAKEHLSTNDGLPHNKIRSLFVDSKDRVWVATRSNSLFAINAEEKHKIQENVELEFSSIAQDPSGHLWAGTSGDGIFKFNSDTLIYFSEADGLESNYCYSLIYDNNGSFWVGHRLSLSRISEATSIITQYGIETGITGDCNNNAMALDGNGHLLIGTSDGLVAFNPKDENTEIAKPMLSITSIRVNDNEMPINEGIVLPYGKYKIRIEFMGIYYKNPDAVKYTYKMADDTEWSEPGATNYALYGRLPDGKYKFLIKACVDGGNCTEEPIELTIIIKKPFWKSWWFIVLSVIVVIFSFYIFVKLREQKQIRFQKFLQKKLDERTKEVVEQKVEIENKNRDITDSINYAQRIQSSILPPIKKLEDNFSGSFVFYLPRDIVSGDFYWFDKVSETKFMIVCADSTGHGVPGAFMSMIGTTLIKDICMRSNLESPSQILQKLDSEIQNTLNQNVDAERSNDGMDIIVCEIDLVTNYLRYASAMRPMIVYHNGEQLYMKGSRNSIGGHNSGNKVFEDEGIQLSKGDIIYMFSDGYPDQFGGSMGKKFKMVRLKNLLKDIYTMPMEQQYEQVKNNLHLWKEGFEQVDDILFMGLKV